MAVRKVRRRLKDGSIREYTYGEPEPRTVDAIMREYRLSPRFRRLAAKSKIAYESGMAVIVDTYGHIPIDAIKRRHILGHRDELADTPGLANKVLVVWSTLMTFAFDREYVTANPAARIEKVPTGEYRRWPDDALQWALENLREPVRRAIVLGLYTGQRVSDCAAMMWSAYDGEWIEVTQQKTGVTLWVPVHDHLKAELDRWERTSTHILTNGRGWPAGERLAKVVSAELRKHPELNGCVFHGLRKTAAARLAEAGCTPHQIAAITGHKTLTMLQHYTREASQREMAASAMEALHRHGKKTGAKNGPKILKFK